MTEADQLRDEVARLVADAARPAQLLSIEDVMARLRVRRSTVFGLLASEEEDPQDSSDPVGGAGEEANSQVEEDQKANSQSRPLPRLRSVKIGRRRLIPEQALIDFIAQLD